MSPISYRTSYLKTARGCTSPISRADASISASRRPAARAKRSRVSSGPAAWQAATPDGSQAFYTEGGVLYRFDVQAAAGGQRIGLTPAGAEVQGVLGVSGDGSYVYFAAKGVLASGGVSGAGNIYVWHEGTIALVSTGGEEDDWTAHTLLYGSEVRAGPDEGVRSARVSGDGRTLMFTSRASLSATTIRERATIAPNGNARRRATRSTCTTPDRAGPAR